ncbi:hypothetical protein DL771_009756 [Monosporascus sp. 5C6A]|nr:hypothetical protein DL771_009756 [Monosporascus sp. 5C6A]
MSSNCAGCSHRLRGARSPSFITLPALKLYCDEECPYCLLFHQALLELIPDLEVRFGHDAVFRFNSASEFLLYADANAEPWVGDTSSGSSIDQANQWINHCLSSHPLCGKDGPSLLPDRVLDLGEDEDEEEVKLSETAGLQGRYVALSHCWGTQQPLTTTSTTMEDRKAGIPLDVLPKTFRDTVRITRGLGIRYLWVDSLCIIQDSPEDWQVQSSKMSSVYRNSWLTLSATRASSAADGCFSSGQGVNVKAPDEEGEDPMAILFPEAAKLRQDLRLNLTFQIQHPDPKDRNRRDMSKHFPLLYRAWTYQERLLAPRVLHFGPQELYWECMQDLDCHCGLLKWSEQQHMSSYLNRDTSRELPAKIAHYAALHVGASRRPQQPGEDKRRQKLLSRWGDMVQEYTRHKLTFPGDRLPAFSGVAAEMADALGMRYCAGLWEGNLPLGLLWRRARGWEVAKPRSDPPTAPSWSWASLDGPVEYPLSLGGPYREFQRPVVPLAEVEGVCCVPAGRDERGQLVPTESYVLLSAHVVEAALCIEDKPRSKFRWMYASTAMEKGIRGPKGQEYPRQIFQIKVGKEKLSQYKKEGGPETGEPVDFDHDIQICDKAGNWTWEEKEGLYCARILKSSDTYYWLVLRLLDRENFVFERIGFVHGTHVDWHGEKRTIKII